MSFRKIDSIYQNKSKAGLRFIESFLSNHSFFYIFFMLVNPESIHILKSNNKYYQNYSQNISSSQAILTSYFPIQSKPRFSLLQEYCILTNLWVSVFITLSLFSAQQPERCLKTANPCTSHSQSSGCVFSSHLECNILLLFPTGYLPTHLLQPFVLLSPFCMQGIHQVQSLKSVVHYYIVLFVDLQKFLYILVT